MIKATQNIKQEKAKLHLDRIRQRRANPARREEIRHSLNRMKRKEKLQNR